MSSELRLEMTVRRSGKLTRIELRTPDGISSRGYSFRHPSDARDNEIGDTIALSRALYSLSRKFEKRAWGHIKFKQRRKETGRFKTAEIPEVSVGKPYRLVFRDNNVAVQRSTKTSQVQE